MEYYLAIKKWNTDTWINVEKLCYVKEANHKRPYII